VDRKIAFFDGSEIDHRTKYSVTIDGRYIEPSGDLKYLNHSCSSNAFFDKRWLIASREIYPGEEIAINYFSTERAFSNGFRCNCGSKSCNDRVENPPDAVTLKEDVRVGVSS